MGPSMHTDELIAALARGVEPVVPYAARRYVAATLVAGMSLALFGMYVMLGLNADLADYSRRAMFWVKVGMPLVVMLAGMLALERLARPGVALGMSGHALLAPVCMVWVLGAQDLWRADPGSRGALLLGETWFYCPLYIALLALPAFVIALWALRNLAPTRLRLTGAVAGLFAGAIGAWAYALHCPELAAPFIATWYVLGMLVPAVVGALLGPRLLRW